MNIKKIKLKFLLFVMGVSGKINSWAWQKHVEILRKRK